MNKATFALVMILFFFWIPESQATSGCKEYQYAVHYKFQLPSNGKSVGVSIKWNTSSLKGGHVAAWIGPTNSSGNVWIQAGLAKDAPEVGGDGIYKYIEYNYPGVYSIIDKGTAKPNVIYKASVTKVKDGVWTASIGGSALGKNVKPSGMNVTQFTGESYRPGKGTCQLMDINFSSSTWKLSAMEYAHDSPYKTKSSGSNQWRASGS
jgi:hypothetical protein